MPVEGDFRRSKRSTQWFVIFVLAIIIGSIVVAVGIMEQEDVVVPTAIVGMIVVGILVVRRQKRQRIHVRLTDDKLIIKGGGYHIQMKPPFRYQTGVQRIRATSRMPEYHYLRMVLDVYGKPLVFEEHVPAGVQPPKLEEIVGVSSALGIAELASTKQYPGTLWSIIQQLDSISSNEQKSQIQRDIENLYRIGGQQLNSESYFAAIKTFSEIIRLTPDSPYPYYNRGMAHFYNGQDFHRAITDLTTTIRLKPDFDKAYQMRGLVRAEQGDWEGLRDDATTAIRLNPNDSDLFNLRGTACYRLQDDQSALADFNHAIELNGMNPEPYHNRGLVKQRQGNLHGAISDFRYALQLNSLFEPAQKSLEHAEQHKRDLGI